MSEYNERGAKNENREHKKIDKDYLFDLKNQIMMAEALNRTELEPVMRESIGRYTGKYIPKYGYNWDIILNEVYPIIQTSIPAVFFRNPRAYLKPRNKTFIAKIFDPSIGRKVEMQLDSQKSANTQEAILNYSLERIKYKQEVRKVTLDAFLFPHGVLWHGYKGNFGMTEEQSMYVKDGMTFVRRLCPTRFIKDPNVNMSNLDEAKWIGRIIDIPYTDLLEDDKFDIEKDILKQPKIKGFKGYGDMVGGKQYGITDEFGRALQPGGGDIHRLNQARALVDFADKNFQNSKYCKFVRLYELYCRPSKKEARDGEKGKIIVLTFEQEKPLRVDPWSVKADGFPAKVLQFNELPDAMFGLADLDTYKAIANRTVKSMSQLRKIIITKKILPKCKKATRRYYCSREITSTGNSACSLQVVLHPMNYI